MLTRVGGIFYWLYLRKFSNFKKDYKFLSVYFNHHDTWINKKNLQGSPEPKAQVSFTHDLVSGICRPLTFHILIFWDKLDRPWIWLSWLLIGRKIGNLWKYYSSEPLDGMKPKLVHLDELENISIYLHLYICTFYTLKKFDYSVLLIKNKGILKATIFSSPGHRPCELLSWVCVRRPSVR